MLGYPGPPAPNSPKDPPPPRNRAQKVQGGVGGQDLSLNTPRDRTGCLFRIPFSMGLLPVIHHKHLQLGTVLQEKNLFKVLTV